MPTSSEFVDLCQSQVALLTQGLGAALSIVYLAEELTTATDTHLVPIVSHPEMALNWGEDQILAFLTQMHLNQRQQRLLAPQSDAPVQHSPEPFESADFTALSPQLTTYSTNGLLPQQQIVLPLIYQERVMGLLVTARADRAWSEAERGQIEHIAQSLTAACVLDWRIRWLAQDLQHQQLLEERKTDLFDNLLHQFRNPLTALRTFGKLLVKRIQPSDANHSAAESIVRESDRLQDLLKQLDVAIDLEADDLIPLLTAPATNSRVAATAPVTVTETELQSATSVHSTSSTVITQTSNQSSPQPSTKSLPSSETRLLLGSAIDLQPHTITEVLLPLLDSATAIAQDRQLTLCTAIESHLPPVWLDPRALREVLNNLIDNAIKYTPVAGQVIVSVQRGESVGERSGGVGVARQAILIADTGPGIPTEDLQHLFERHYRGVQAKTEIPGTGLGLAIARDLVQQMQGEIEIFSPASSCDLLTQTELQPFSQAYLAQADAGTAAVVWLNEAQQASEPMPESEQNQSE